MANPASKTDPRDELLVQAALTIMSLQAEVARLRKSPIDAFAHAIQHHGFRPSRELVAIAITEHGPTWAARVKKYGPSAHKNRKVR